MSHTDANTSLTRQFATYLAPLLREVLLLELIAAQEEDRAQG